MANNEDQNLVVFNTYTPFRNFLRKMDLFRSLQAIWAHTVFQQFKRRLPRYIVGLPLGYENAKTKIDFLKYNLHLWELETIAKEVILNSAPLGKDKNLENWNYLSKAVNRLKELENTIAGQYSSRDNVLLELHRIAHRQFPWQENLPNENKLIRYWKVYAPLQEYFQRVYAIEFDIYLTISMMLFGFYIDHFALAYPPNIEIKNIDKVLFDRYLNYFCKDIETLAVELKSQLQINQDYVYGYHSLKGFPLVKIDYHSKTFVVCALPTLFFNRISEGLFYDLINVPGFDNAFGEAFQNYIGEYLEKALKNICSVLPEESYGPRRHKKRTIDWIVEDKEGNALFIECKTKRMTVGAKSALIDLQSLEKDLLKLAEAVVQMYETAFDYEKGLYPQFSFDEQRKVYLVVATLEEWYLFGDKTQILLNEQVNKIFDEKGFDKKYLEKYPYMVIATENIELIADLLNKKTIDEIFATKVVDQDKQLWHIRSYLLDQSPNDFGNIKNPFKTDWEQFLDAAIKKAQGS